MANRRPNVLFITCHDLGRHLGAYGRRSVVSPALDALANDGVRFDRAFATAPTCCPARAAMHTGRYPHSTGMLGFLFEPFNWSLNEGERHVAGLLAEHGYRTAQVGFQHVVKSEPIELRKALGFDDVAPLEPNADSATIGQEACAYLRDYDGDVPLYLEVGFFDVHTRWESFPQVGWGETEVGRGIEVPGFLPDTRATRAQAAGLQGAIRELDHGIGTILETLAAVGMAEDTWVIFASDHGLPFPGAKGTLYEPGLQIALLMRWPGAGLTGGRALPQLVSNVDIVPTVLEGLGIPAPDNLEGRSAWPLLEGTEDRGREFVHAESTFGLHYEPLRSVRTERHKLIFVPEMSPSLGSETDAVHSDAFQELLAARPYFRRPIFELYDLEEDPMERRDVSGRAAYADVQAALVQELRSWMESTDDPLLRGPVASPRYGEAMEALNDAATRGDG